MQPQTQQQHQITYLQSKSHNHTATITQQQLNSELFEYYLQLRNEELPALREKIPEEFDSIQRQIISIVELRKNMEKVLEIQALQGQHFSTVHSLVEHNLKLNDSIDQMANRIKANNEESITQFVNGLKETQKERAIDEGQIIAKSNKLLLQLADIKRTFNADAIFPSPIQTTEEDDQQQKPSLFQESFNQLLESQKQRWDLARFIYSVKLKELSLRDELLEERERGQQDFQRVNSELIETLLREKQRDKNLRKKDNEKFGELIKQRDQIDLQFQNLSHSEKSLLPHLQNELMRMKTKVKENESRHQIQMQKMHKKYEQLMKEMQRITAENKKLQAALTDKQLKHNELLAQFRSYQQQTETLKKSSEASLKSMQGDTERELEKARLKCKKLQQQNTQFEAKNEQLQSQYNELILKSSQLNHIKADLSQKFDKTAKKAQQLQAKLQEFKANLNSKNEELVVLQQNLNSIKSQKDNFQQLIHSLQRELALSKENSRQCEERITYLQKQLTDNFILHNQEHQNSLQRIAELQHTITLNSQQLLRLRQTQTSLPPSDLPPDFYSSIRQQLTAELQRSERARSSLLDSLVQRIGQLII